MSGFKDFITIKVSGIEEAKRRIGNIPGTIKDGFKDTAVLKELGTLLVGSAVKTINAGGRPVAYKPLAASTIARRSKKGKGSTKPLVFLGTMRQSLDYEVDAGSLYLTSVEYLKYHQFEENRTKANFPARPVWGVQDEDNAEITDIILAGLRRNL